MLSRALHRNISVEQHIKVSQRTGHSKLLLPMSWIHDKTGFPLTWPYSFTTEIYIDPATRPLIKISLVVEYSWYSISSQNLSQQSIRYQVSHLYDQSYQLISAAAEHNAELAQSIRSSHMKGCRKHGQSTQGTYPGSCYSDTDVHIVPVHNLFGRVINH